MCSKKGVSAPDTYEVEASRLLPYPRVTGKEYKCAEGEVASGGDQDEVKKLTADCGSGSVISCFTYASMGKMAGKCGSCDDSLKDRDCVAWLPGEIGDTCIGRQSCEIEFKSDKHAVFSILANSVTKSGNDVVTSTGSTPSKATFTVETCGTGAIKLLAFCTNGEEVRFS